jgi:hypothetical protein
MLLCRTRRVQAEPVLCKLLDLWPTAPVFAGAVGVEAVVRPCGLHNQRARQLQRFTNLWLSDGWEALSELPGCGVYVRDCVGLFCFGDTNLESDDKVLHAWASLIKRV